MSKVDDELTRRLRRAERPVDADGLFEGLERRRSHRERVRRVQAGLLALAVLAATAGGFVALREVFGEPARDVGEPPLLPGNGEIVFSAEGADGYAHLYAIQPDGSGRRQITDFGTDDTDPSVSPDGRTIAFVHQLEDVDPALATIPVKGGTVTWLSDPGIEVRDPAWSPDGSQIAFVGHSTSTTGLFIADVNTHRVRRIDLLAAAGYDANEIRALVPSHPTWSPDGSWIAIAAVVESDAARSSDLAVVHPNGTGFEWLAADDGPDEFAPTWSPDGSRLAFTRVEADGDEIRTIAPTGGSETLLATAGETSLTLELAWAPDASALLASDGNWIYRVDAKPQDDPSANFHRLVEGHSPAWQPLPVGSALPSPEPEPSPSPSNAADADIGLDFRLCHMTRLEGVDFLGDGAFGNAWVGTRVREDGSCPEQVEPRAVVAADFNGDEIADSWWGGMEHCLFCETWDATDLDADGDEELVVLESSSSTPSYLVLAARRDPAGRYQLRPVEVGAPGHDAARLPAGEPLRIVTGGDEGFSGWVRCEGFPAAPVLVLTWRDHPIEGETMEVHETKLVLQEDGAAHIIETDDYSAPVGTPIPGVSDAPACGVDWQILG